MISLLPLKIVSKNSNPRCWECDAAARLTVFTAVRTRLHRPRGACRADQHATDLMPPGSILMEEKMKHQHLSQHRQRSLTLALAIVVIPVLLLTGSSRAQDIYAYPAKGQSQAQQDRDRYECHSWAAKQTGFDPSKSQAVTSDTPAASNQRMPAQGHVVRGAGRGAALGAVGGAITGDAGTGAAAGAAMGALAGGMRRRQQRLQQNQQQQQATSQAAANSQQSQRTAYHRAMAACLTGRG